LPCCSMPTHVYMLFFIFCCCCCCCQVILRRDPGSAQDACAVSSSVGLGDQASLLPDIWPDQAEQEWRIDPSYYQYQVCECLFVSSLRQSGHVHTLCRSKTMPVWASAVSIGSSTCSSRRQ
jgi:hypothetical protein